MKTNNYYKQYLANHTNPKCRLMHFIGQWVTIIFTVYVFYSKIWWLIPFIPVVVYPFAISGHYLFGQKGDKPSFTKMGYLQAKKSDWLMFIDILKGKLSIW
tara:strand:- start:9790 stop:10092 length:303 start_codon:yes stop_codon:yes gene_type:complete